MRKVKTIIKSPYRSKFEGQMASLLQHLKVDFSYESKESVIHYEVPASPHKYTPDFKVGNIIFENKGYWPLTERKKMVLIVNQFPNLDIRMVFQNPKVPIRRGSKTTYADFCNKNGIRWGTMADVADWIREAQIKTKIR